MLGESQTRTVPAFTAMAFTVMAFTGNNCAPRGDLASRSLCVRLTVNRPGLENRTFTHADPIGWTEANRGRALASLYTILLGNPRLRASAPAAAETRVKAWWHLVGSAIEHAAKLHVADTAERVVAMVADTPKCSLKAIRFADLFAEGEADEEQTSALATVLGVLRTRWPSPFKASEVSLFAGEATEAAIEFRGVLEAATEKPLPTITPTTITWRLKALADASVLIEGATVALRCDVEKSKGNVDKGKVDKGKVDKGKHGALFTVKDVKQGKR